MIKWPVFGQDRDQFMFMINSEQGLDSLETIDIEGKEYMGWDVCGIPVEFFLDKRKIRVRPTSEIAQKEELRRAILKYAALASPKIPFKTDLPEDDIIGLFMAVEQHIKSTGMMRTIKRLATEIMGRLRKTKGSHFFNS